MGIMTNKSDYLKMKTTYLNAKYGNSKHRKSRKQLAGTLSSSNFHKHYHEHNDGTRHVHNEYENNGHQHQKYPPEKVTSKHKYEDAHDHTHNEYDSSPTIYTDSIDSSSPLTSSTNNLDLLNNELTKNNNIIKELKQQLIAQEASTTELNEANAIISKQKKQLTQLETQLRDTNNTGQQITLADHEAQIMELKNKSQNAISRLNNTLKDKDNEILKLIQKSARNEDINVVNELNKKLADATSAAQRAATEKLELE